MDIILCMDLKTRAKQIKRDIPAVFLALKHKKTPVLAKILAALTVGYALSPIDFVADYKSYFFEIG